MEFPSLFNWSGPFPIKGLLGGIFHFYSNFDRTFCEQTVETLIRRRGLRRLIWVYNVCLCPTKRTLCLYELNSSKNSFLDIIRVLKQFGTRSGPMFCRQNVGPYLGLSSLLVS